MPSTFADWFGPPPRAIPGQGELFRDVGRTQDTLLDEALRLLHEYDTGLATGAQRELEALRTKLDSAEDKLWQNGLIHEDH